MRFLLSILMLFFVACSTHPVKQPVAPDETTKEVVKSQPSAADLAAAAAIQKKKFWQPYASLKAMSDASIDPQKIVPADLLASALAYFHANQAKFKNPAYVTVVDFSKNSKVIRMFIVNMSSGAVESFHVAHGKGSDPSNSGMATKFSNTPGSEMSSLGYYLTAETFQGEHGLELRLDGLSTTNSNVRSRAILVHGAAYVYDINQQAGRSWGCFAVSMANHEHVINEIKGGSLIYAGISGN